MSYVLTVKLLKKGLERILCFLVLVIHFFQVFWMLECEAVVAIWEESGNAHMKCLPCVPSLSMLGLQCKLCQGPVGEVTGRVLYALGAKLSVL